MFSKSFHTSLCVAALAVAAPAGAEASTTGPLVIEASDDWIAMPRFSTDIAAGGVFDFSALVDAPAGKHGRIVVTPDGRFEFADRPGVRARFWGVNLVSSANFLPKEEVEKLAVRLARSGYNTVRIHHYDRSLAVEGAPSGTLDPEALDRLDYLFATLKKHGLYISTDLYSLRRFSHEELASFGIDPEALEGLSGGEAAGWFKACLPLSDAAFEAWERFAHAVLTHRNPYTGLTWAEDPALIGICPVNEDTLPKWVDRATGRLKERHEQAFAEWLAGEEAASRVDESRDAAFHRFLAELQIKTNRRLFASLRGIGVTVPLTGTNFENTPGMVAIREAYDFVDNHQYWNHPRFQPGRRFQLPYSFHQRSAINGHAHTPRVMMPSRVTGKPYTVTEFNFVRPNHKRAEGGVLMPAYASLQDWDALYNFDYANRADIVLEGAFGGVFSIANDPVGLLADRVSALLFLRGDISPARGRLTFVAEPSIAYAEQNTSFPTAFSRLGLVTRIGSRFGDPAAIRAELPDDTLVVDRRSSSASPAKGIHPADRSLASALVAAGVLPAGSVDAGDRRFRSETGQIELDSEQGTLRVVAPRCELFVLPPRAALSGEICSAANGDTFGTVSVVSVDGLPLTESARLLVLHLTDAAPSGTRFSDATRQSWEDPGKPPYLVARGDARLTLKLPGHARYEAWAVDETGARLHAVPFEPADKAWTLRLDTARGDIPVLAYEIVRLPR